MSKTMPCGGFARERAFPDLVRGPVLRIALRRFACLTPWSYAESSRIRHQRNLFGFDNWLLPQRGHCPILKLRVIPMRLASATASKRCNLSNSVDPALVNETDPG
jgi:hypothetical protein